MPFTTTLSTTSTLDETLITRFSEGISLAYKEAAIMPNFVTQRLVGPAASHKFRKYTALSAATSALTEADDVTSTAMTDSVTTITPAEYGLVVTYTELVNLQSGGNLNPMVAYTVGENLAETVDALAIQSLEAGTNTITPSDTAEASLVATQVISADVVQKAYAKLRAAKIQKMPGGNYVSVIHPYVAADLKASTAFKDSVRYGAPDRVFQNYIGTYLGFDWYESANVTTNTDAGDGSVDTFHTLCFGYNALGYAESKAPTVTITGPFDKLARFMNLGWYGVFGFGIVDQNALQVITTASAYGTNS